MKKIAIFLLMILIVVSAISYLYINQKLRYREMQKENAKLDIVEGQEITGQDLVTLINKVIDTNRKNEVSKDKKGNYVDNEENSIQMDISFIDVDVTYNIERINQGGMSSFLQNYRGIIFKCSEVQFHKSTGKIKYIKVEQITE